MKKLCFGIIGTGATAKVHADCLDQNAEAELFAVASSSLQRAQEAQSTYNLPVYAEFITLLERADNGVVITTTKSGGHLEPTLAAAKVGTHVLCEKPLEVNVDNARQMINACRAAEVKLGCIFQNRFNPQ